MNVDVCSLYLALPEEQTLEIIASSGLDRGAIGARLAFTQGLTGKVARTGKPVVAWDIKELHSAGRDLIAALALIGAES